MACLKCDIKAHGVGAFVIDARGNRGQAMTATSRAVANNEFVSEIEAIGAVVPRDRMTPRQREEGCTEPGDSAGDTIFRLDLELCSIGRGTSGRASSIR